MQFSELEKTLEDDWELWAHGSREQTADPAVTSEGLSSMQGWLGLAEPTFTLEASGFRELLLVLEIVAYDGEPLGVVHRAHLVQQHHAGPKLLATFQPSALVGETIGKRMRDLGINAIEHEDQAAMVLSEKILKLLRKEWGRFSHEAIAIHVGMPADSAVLNRALRHLVSRGRARKFTTNRAGHNLPDREYTGRLITQETCESCNGGGVGPTGDTSTTCYPCGGSGVLTICAICSGHGVSPEDSTEPAAWCLPCDGNGIL